MPFRIRVSIPAQVRVILCSLLAISSGQAAIGEVFQAPEISIAGLHSPTLSFEGAQLICRVRVINPNKRALSVQNAKFSLKLSGAPAATGRLLENTEIPSLGEKEVDVLVDVIPSAAVTWLPLFFGSSNFSTPFEVAGVIYADNFNSGNLPFHQTGELQMTNQGIKIRPDE